MNNSGHGGICNVTVWIDATRNYYDNAFRVREYILRQVIDFHSLMIVDLETSTKRKKKKKKKNVISKLKIGFINWITR